MQTTSRKPVASGDWTQDVEQVYERASLSSLQQVLAPSPPPVGNPWGFSPFARTHRRIHHSPPDHRATAIAIAEAVAPLAGGDVVEEPSSATRAKSAGVQFDDRSSALRTTPAPSATAAAHQRPNNLHSHSSPIHSASLSASAGHVPASAYASFQSIPIASPSSHQSALPSISSEVGLRSGSAVSRVMSAAAKQPSRENSGSLEAAGADGDRASGSLTGGGQNSGALKAGGQVPAPAPALRRRRGLLAELTRAARRTWARVQRAVSYRHLPNWL